MSRPLSGGDMKLLHMTAMSFLETCKVFTFYDFRIKAMFDSSLPPVVCMRVHVLLTLVVFACVYKWCCVFVLFFFVLSVSLDCPFLIPPSVFSNVYSSNDWNCKRQNNKVHCHHSGFWLLYSYWSIKYEVLRTSVYYINGTLKKIEMSKNGTTQTLPGYFERSGNKID
jgi:hypothetical protein